MSVRHAKGHRSRQRRLDQKHPQDTEEIEVVVVVVVVVVVDVEVANKRDRVLEEVDRAMDKDKRFLTSFATTAEVLDTRHQCAHQQDVAKDVAEAEPIVDVPREAGDVKHGMRAWRQAAMITKLLPKQFRPLSISREMPEASERSAP